MKPRPLNRSPPWIAQALRLVGALRPERRLAKALIARAKAERARNRHYAAAVLYEEALRLAPADAGLRVQCGHMFKEAGELARAEQHYLRAREQLPEDADLALQLGHFYKIAGRADACEAAYRRALELSPGWAEPLSELARLCALPDRLADGAGRAGAPDLEGLAPELFPGRTDAPARRCPEGVHIRQLGAPRRRTDWGLRRTLGGVEAIRGFCISAEPVDEVRVVVAGHAVACEPLRALDLDAGRAGLRKFVFNIWVDLSGIAPGPARIELGLFAAGRKVLGHRETVVITPPLAEIDHPGSDGVVDPLPGDPRSIEDQVNARPSMIRDARRSILASPPRNILVVRADQLGDMVVSTPAVRRLRELFPQARLVGLLTPANADFARSAGLFDEIIVIDFPEDPLERRRTMPPEAQQALQRRLQAHHFDIAIDLAEGGLSRPLLLLSGARFLYGFHDHEWPWLTGGFECQTHDPRNGLEIAAQSTKALSLVERLGNSLASRAKIERRPGLRRDALAEFGVLGDDRYALLHAGARIEISRWPHFGELAARLLDATDLKVLLLTDGPPSPAEVPAELERSQRFRLIERRLPFDSFDALISFADVFVGNDSGPKHLAALRGVRVVSLHSARVNWNEWGQELTGKIISRRVPCAGCALFHDADECGKDFACIRKIAVDEVFEAVMAELNDAAAQA